MENSLPQDWTKQIEGCLRVLGLLIMSRKRAEPVN